MSAPAHGCAARRRCQEVHSHTKELSPRCFSQPSALLSPSPCSRSSPGLWCHQCPAPRSRGCHCPCVLLARGRRSCHGTSLSWLQVRPRGSAGWESSLRQKPPVRLIFQAGQTQHEMKVKETNSVETLRDLPTPLRVRVCVGARVLLGLPWGSRHLLCVPWPSGFRHGVAALCLSFPCPCSVGGCVLLLALAMNWVL